MICLIRVRRCLTLSRNNKIVSTLNLYLKQPCAIVRMVLLYFHSLYLQPTSTNFKQTPVKKPRRWLYRIPVNIATYFSRKSHKDGGLCSILFKEPSLDDIRIEFYTSVGNDLQSLTQASFWFHPPTQPSTILVDPKGLVQKAQFSVEKIPNKSMARPLLHPAERTITTY